MSVLSPVERTYALRLILLGEAGAGKTCLFHWIKFKVATNYTSGD